MGRGRLVITGLAWSGNGTIKRVDVSLDGGRNWQRHGIDGPSLPKALHRFYLDINWDGSELLLQSRAIDDQGLVPADQERAARRAWRELDLSQQWHPDMARQQRRGG
jgi:sulfane dehydrogenase subunit SoxC